MDTSDELYGEAIQMCALLARISIEAIAAYATACKVSGSFFISSLMDCINGLQGPMAFPNSSSAASKSFQTACQLLAQFAQTLQPARQAIEVLKMENSSSISTNIPDLPVPQPRLQPQDAPEYMQFEQLGQPFSCTGESHFTRELEQSYGDWDIHSAQLLLDTL